MLARLAMRSASVLTKACSCGSNSRYFSSLLPVWMIKFSAISLLFDLVQNARIFYLIVFCKEDNLSQYLGSLRIFIYERQEQASAILRMYRKNGYLCTTFLMDHTAAQMDIILTQFAFNVSETSFYRHVLEMEQRHCQFHQHAAYLDGRVAGFRIDASGQIMFWSLRKTIANCQNIRRERQMMFV